MTYTELFDALWQQYTLNNPQAKRIHDSIAAREGQKPINDHIALRTLDNPSVHIDVLAQPFIDAGYEAKGEYEFPIKKLYAQHFEHPDERAPKVFISQLSLGAFDEWLQDLLNHCIDHIPTPLLNNSEALLTSGVSWNPLSHDTYQRLANVSEYAAWFYAYGYCANHFTISVNDLTTFDDLEALNAFITEQGYTLNGTGGVIKGTQADFLRQSSTLSEKSLVVFDEGSFQIPNCYYEFAERYTMPDGKMYTGFVAQSADKIFESTNRH